MPILDAKLPMAAKPQLHDMARMLAAGAPRASPRLAPAPALGRPSAHPAALAAARGSKQQRCWGGACWGGCRPGPRRRAAAARLGGRSAAAAAAFPVCAEYSVVCRGGEDQRAQLELDKQLKDKVGGRGCLPGGSEDGGGGAGLPAGLDGRGCNRRARSPRRLTAQALPPRTPTVHAH
jgi:hypothetical protein